MTAGELRQRVTVQARTEISDGHDGFTESWTNVSPIRRAAKVEPLQGRDLERARQIDPRISHQVTLRYWRAYANELDGGRARLVYHDLSDRTFEMVTPPIDVNERHEWLQMMCRELS